jgi:hypothetical protein
LSSIATSFFSLLSSSDASSFSCSLFTSVFYFLPSTDAEKPLSDTPFLLTRLHPGCLHVGCMLDEVALEQDFLGVSPVFPLHIIILLSSHTNPSPSPELWECPDQAAHYHTLGLQMRSSVPDQALGSSQCAKLEHFNNRYVKVKIKLSTSLTN